MQVHRLICEGTVEDRIAALLDAEAGARRRGGRLGRGWVTELDDEGLADLVRLATRPTGGVGAA